MAGYRKRIIEINEDGEMEVKFLRYVYKGEPVYDIHFFTEQQTKEFYLALKEYFSKENVKKREEQKKERERKRKEFDEKYPTEKMKEFYKDVPDLFGSIFGNPFE